MALTKIDFEELRASRDDDCYKAFCRPSAREDDRKRIVDDIAEFKRRGGIITTVNSAAGGGSRNRISDQEQRTMELKIKQLRKDYGNTCNIRWDVSTNRFRAFYRGSEAGMGFDDIKKAAKAIENAARLIKV